MQNSNPIQELKKIVKNSQIGQQGNEIYSSNWFLASLLTNSNRNLHQATAKIKNLEHNLASVNQSQWQGKLTQSKSIAKFF